MHYKSYKSLQPDMDNFLQNYRLLRFYTPPSDPIRNRKPKRERVCRFCVRKTPEVKFNSEAHIIPRLFGNNFGDQIVEHPLHYLTPHCSFVQIIVNRFCALETKTH